MGNSAPLESKGKKQQRRDHQPGEWAFTEGVLVVAVGLDRVPMLEGISDTKPSISAAAQGH